MTTTEITTRAGGWMQTYTGRQFWPLDPRPEEVDIEDIAWHLSMLCRYTGATRRFYSVAEHCVHISHAVPPWAALWGLLHDAPEAYLNDLAPPIKGGLPAYKVMEQRLEQCIVFRFGVVDDPGVRAKVKDADLRILQMERDALLAPPPFPWATDAAGPPLPGIVIEGWDPYTAYELFTARFEELIHAR